MPPARLPRRSASPATSPLPKTGLASIQSAWSAAVGEQLAAVATPVSERAGTLTIECADSVWAQELDLMQGQLLERLREALGEQAPEALKFRLGADTT